MEFVEGIIKANKMCEEYRVCSTCPIKADIGRCPIFGTSHHASVEELRKAETIVSEWEPPVAWEKVAVDTPIWVWDDDEPKPKKRKRHFAKYENGRVFAWYDGKTSWTTSGHMNDWDHAELR